MKHITTATLAFCLILTAQVCVAAEPAAHQGTVTMSFDLSARGAGKPVDLWMPYPVSDRDQQISDITVRGDYDGSAVYADPSNGMTFIHARWDGNGTKRTLEMRFTVRRSAVARTEFPMSSAAWNTTDFKQYLASTSMGPVNGDIKVLADSITAGRETVLDKARAVYDWVTANMFRDPSVRGCGTGNVPALLKSRGGKCTDISSVFVALARAAGIPAREVFGIRLGKQDGDDMTSSQHCWAEFYLPGYDWVPVDPADVRKAILVEKLEETCERIAPLKESFWGRLEPYRMRLATGRDIILTPPQKGAPLNSLMYPYAEIAGTPADSLDPKSFSYRFTFRRQ